MLAAIAALALGVAASGCAWLGPDIVRVGRPAYNDAILATNDEQLLQNVVRMRFVDSLGFLAVNAIHANVTFTATGTVNVGFGPASNYAGQLVPFAGTLSTEQNPTISYSPVTGDQLLRQFAAEIPLEQAILMINYSHDARPAWRSLVRRVNNLRNPDFPNPPVLVVDPRFEEVVELAGRLQSYGTLYWVKLAGGATGSAIVLHSYSPQNSREVARLLELLAIRKPERDGDDVIIPVQLSTGSPSPNTISLETRSLLDLMRLAAASIELPADTPGAARFPTPGPAAHGLRIRSAEQHPPESRVSTQYRGRWYYIDNNDDASKQWFQALQLLAGAQPAEGAGMAPVLTIPVSGRR
jgi:hypothetical protein